MQFEKITLEGMHVRLESLSAKHRDGLIKSICDGELWNLFVTMVPKIEDVDEFIENAISAHENEQGLTFATIDKASGRVVGSTRFMKASLPNKRVEIGFTFIAKSFQKTQINTEAKLLMLTHAFEGMGLNRVEFLTDYLNHTSRNAILRLGAKEEGILRNHMVMSNGRVRDSVLFSITNHDWAGVKQHLAYKLASKA
ncbi:MAG: RimJ/RimL family protein N-acetyltransferase [Oceanicoccus sp.]|jgi:RimJ/RimL family protein N-acetyltransferase